MDKINLAIVAPNAGTFSETFIRSHVNNLDANTSFFHTLDCGMPTKVTDIELNKEPLNFLLNILGGIIGDRIINLKYFFKRELKKRKIQIVLAEYGPTAVGILDVLKLLRIPLIVHFHGYDAYRVDVLNLYASSYKELFKYSYKIIAVSKDMQNQLISLGAPQEKVIINPCGPDEDYFNNNPSHSERSFVFVGRLVDKKAPYLLLLSLKRVIRKHPDVILYIGGDGPLRETCYNLILALGLNKNARLLGVLSKSEILDLYKKCLGFVQHSITTLTNDHEGTPVAVNEALAAGLPVVATKHAGILDIVNDGENGFLVDEKDWTTFADRMVQILDNPYMFKNGRNLIKQDHIQKLNSLIYSAVEK